MSFPVLKTIPFAAPFRMIAEAIVRFLASNGSCSVAQVVQEQLGAQVASVCSEATQHTAVGTL